MKKSICSALFLAVLAGCGASPTESSDVSVASSLGQNSKPVASLTLSNGNVVNFFDVVRGVAVTETGRAGEAVPVAKVPPGARVDGLVSFWQGLAPDVPVPQALRDLQAKMLRPTVATEPVPSSGGPPSSGGEPFAGASSSPSAGGGVSPFTASFAGTCGNACCDIAWMKANIQECDPNGWPSGANFSWGYYDYGWSYVQQPNSVVTMSHAAVCAAKGTSQWSGSWRDGGGFNTGVGEGYWLEHYYFAATCFPNPISCPSGYHPTWLNYYVNSSTNQHWHAFCGALAY